MSNYKEGKRKISKVKLELVRRFSHLQTTIHQVEERTFDKSQLEDLLNKLKRPIALEDSFFTIKNWDPLGSYSTLLPPGYREAIVRVEKAIRRSKSFEPQLDAVNKILGEFRVKIDSVDETRHPEAKQTATELLGGLEDYRNQIFHCSYKDAMKEFVHVAKKEINKAMPGLEKNLGWGEYGYKKATIKFEKAINELNEEAFQELLDRVNKILDEFQQDIESIATHHPKAKQTAEELLDILQDYRDHVFYLSLPNILGAFFLIAKDAIEKGIPILEQDLGWGNELSTMIGELVNILLSHNSSNQYPRFFSEKTVDATETEEIECFSDQVKFPGVN
ncbi:hypothetical protein [Legionella maioricensis]|uniref:Uncharacterized protein n=1 Tax=Legionella maioricensis TaxID=2896528 RepID=A0A9X2D3A1_9GAMM|nr:hypothetical protein [Legionella maioricensis]MCL9684852.1 hypothetical protein [Legionella maioricensis]MCL9688532.1 hypothetical protein [Legionella maioricensis]